MYPVHVCVLCNLQNANDLPVLTWNSTVTHVFDKAGTYRMSVEAVNSLSSVYKEQLIQIFGEVFHVYFACLLAIAHHLFDCFHVRFMSGTDPSQPDKLGPVNK